MADNPADTPQNTGDPLTDLAKRDVEQALSETEALAADVVEQVGGSTQTPDGKAQSPTAEPAEPQSDEADQSQPETQPDGKAPEQDQEDQSGGNVDDKLNELESLLSQMHDKQDEGEAQDQAGVDQQSSSDRPADESGPDQPQPEKDAADQAAALDDQIAAQADQQSDQQPAEGEQADESASQAEQEGDGPEQPGETDQEQQADGEAAGQAEQSARLVRVLGPVIYVLNLIDKPFKGVDPFIKQMVGVVAVATLVMAAMVLVYNLLFG